MARQLIVFLKSYHEFCTFFGFMQLINHVLVIFLERVTVYGFTDSSWPDHQLIYCTRKISRMKRGSHKEMKFHSFKQYKVDLFEQELSN